MLARPRDRAHFSPLMTISQPQEPSLGQALLPVLTLIGLLASSVYLFGDGSSSGPNQIALILAAMVAALVGWRNGHTWNGLQDRIVHGI